MTKLEEALKRLEQDIQERGWHDSEDSVDYEHGHFSLREKDMPEILKAAKAWHVMFTQVFHTTPTNAFIKALAQYNSPPEEQKDE